MILNSPIISGSLTVTGNIITSGSITISGSIASASYASNAELLDGLDATVFTLTSSFNAQTASFTAFTASLNAFSASILAQTASLNSFSASVLTFTGSASTRLGALESYTSSLNAKTASFATTGSNTFIGNQVVSGSIVQSGSFTTTGTIIAQTINVQQVTSSIVYSSGSNIFGNLLGDSQTFTGSVNITGSLSLNNITIPTSASLASTYLQLAGGTLTGALNGTSATFSGNGAFSGVLQVAPTTGTGIIGVGDNFGGGMNAGIYRGGIGVTTTGNYLNIGGYDGVVITTGNAALGSQTVRLTIASTGAATFACSVSIGGADQGYQLDVKRTSTGDSTFDTVANFYKASTHNTGLLLRLKNTIVDLAANNITGGGGPTAGMSFSVSSGGTISTALTIASTGAATFASRVCSAGLTSTGDIYFGIGAGAYEQMTLCYSGYNSASPITTLMPTTAPGSGAITTMLLLKSNGLGGGTGCNHMGLNVQSDTYLATCNGKVGIGTTSPTFALDVASTSADTLRLNRTGVGGTGSASSMSFQVTQTNAQSATLASISAEFMTNWGGDLRLYTKPANGTPNDSVTERMRITSAGLIGMNQPAPSYRLEICSPSSTCLLGLMGASSVNIDMVGFGTSLTYPQARIQLQDDGYYGGMLSFFTKPNGAQANALTERMRICSNGDLTIKGNTHCIYTNSAATISFDINVTRGRFYQALTVDGTVTKGGGSFKIDHPLESKKDTYNLYHSFVESPKADLIYRGKVALTDGYATVNIDTAANMSEGTFEVLVKDVQCFTTNENGWNFVKGTISGNILTIESDNTNCNDEISWMVIGERNDKWFRESTMVDENGKTIVEKLKSETI